MSSILDKPAPQKWPRSQKFSLSPSGVEAEAFYRDALAAARDGSSGRAAFEAQTSAWAGKHLVEPGDGPFLSELKGGPRTMDELVRSLDSCGTTKKEVHAAVDRLTTRGLVEAMVPPPPPPPAPHRW